MKSTWYPYGYNYKSLFDDLSLVWLRGLEQIYFVEEDNRFYMIYDGSGVYGFLWAMSDSPDERQEIQSDNYIQIIEFESAYRQEKYPLDAIAQFAMKKYRDSKA